MYHIVPEDIVKRYLEPQRHYHTLEHIYNGLSVIPMLLRDGSFGDDERKQLLQAWWLHDAVYDIPNNSSQSNEQRSAYLAARVYPNKKIIQQLILATVYPNEKEVNPRSLDAIINDADLFGLAAPREVYERHTAQIRLENSHLSDEVFNANRKKFLTTLVEKQKPLFKTSQGLFLWESKALNNIYREIYAV